MYSAATICRVPLFWNPILKEFVNIVGKDIADRWMRIKNNDRGLKSTKHLFQIFTLPVLTTCRPSWLGHPGGACSGITHHCRRKPQCYHILLLERRERTLCCAILLDSLCLSGSNPMIGVESSKKWFDTNRNRKRKNNKNKTIAIRGRRPWGRSSHLRYLGYGRVLVRRYYDTTAIVSASSSCEAFRLVRLPTPESDCSMCALFSAKKLIYVCMYIIVSRRLSAILETAFLLTLNIRLNFLWDFWILSIIQSNTWAVLGALEPYIKYIISPAHQKSSGAMASRLQHLLHRCWK